MSPVREQVRAMRQVEFLVAGAQKCGTTALDGYLRRHPSVSMARGKEAHFFDDEAGVDWRDPDYGRLHRLYAPSDERLRGEATPITLYWTPAHYRILRYRPEMKFIILLRDPAERAFSHWQMTRKAGLEPLDFSDAIRCGRIRVLDGGGPRVRDGSGPNGLHRIFSYVERGFYARQIEQLARLFPMENMLVLRQTDLLANADAVMAQVAGFLGIPALDAGETLVLNATDSVDGEGMSDQDRDHLRVVYAADLAHLRDLTGHTL